MELYDDDDDNDDDDQDGVTHRETLSVKVPLVNNGRCQHLFGYAKNKPDI